MTPEIAEGRHRRHLNSGTAILSMLGVLAFGPAVQAQQASQNEGIVEHAGTLPDGTDWLIKVPENWNGVLVRDLDFAAGNEPARFQDLLERGYALGGLARHALRRWQYDPQREIYNLEAVQTIFEEQYDPKWVIQFGCSGGGLVTAASAEDFADRIDGAVVLSAHFPMWIMASYFDTWFAMKALLGEAYVRAGLGSASDLQVVNMPNYTGPDGRTFADIQQSWRSAIETLGATPEGRARIALAFAIGQLSPWQVADEPLPDPVTAEALAELIVPSALRIAEAPGGSSRVMFENAASGQQPSANENVDYAVFFGNASPFMKELVEYLYDEAGLDINDDIDRINAAPRVTASDYALEFWSQAGRTADGDIKVPTIRVHSLGDNSIPYSLMQGYEFLVEEKGNTNLYRQALLEFTDHCKFEAAETTALVGVMVERLETGEWPDTSPEALNDRAAALGTGEVPRFIPEGEWRVGNYNRAWTPAQ